MGNQQNRMIDALDQMVASVPGDEILVEFKNSLITEKVFRTLFGDDGARIFVDKAVSINNQIVPLLEMRWKNDSQKSHDTYMNGQIEGRLILPANLKGDAFNIKRKIALMLFRFMGSDKFDLWQRVDGLTMFGNDATANYSVAFGFGGNSLPGILLNIPYQIDLHLWKKKHPEIDPLEELGGEIFDINTYEIGHQIEQDGEIETVFTSEISNEE